MNISESRSPQLRETRQEVNRLAAIDIGQKILEVGGLDALSHTQLKRMEYALMIGPLTRGLASYLDASRLPGPKRSLSAPELLQLTGNKVAKHVIQELGTDPKFGLMSQLARTFSALAWQQAQDVAIYRDTKANITGQTNNVPILDYDPQKQVSALARNVPDWPDHLNLSGAGQDAKIGDIQPADEHIGCPVSFDPKLVVRYYEHMVDLIEYHDSWPEFFSDK
jgi:hypothetical protein